MVFTFNNPPIASLEEWLGREYLLTNGRGGFASNTLVDCPTRKYHGLLALPEEKSGQTYLYLSKIESSLLIGMQQHDLSSNLFPKTAFPEGYRRITRIDIDYYPTTFFSLNEGAVILKKSVLMPRGEDSVLIRYELQASAKPVVLKLMPLIAYREINSLTRQNADLRPRTYFEPNGFKVDPYQNLPPLFIQTSRASVFYPSPDWWKNFEYREEERRGYDFIEDLFTPGVFEVKLKKGDAVTVRAALNACPPRSIETAWDKELTRIQLLKAGAAADEEPLRTLKAQASHFTTDAPIGILAGFPWFAVEWGRDALLSLPGLFLSRGLFREALAFLTRYGEYESSGFLPNIVARRGGHQYNSLDTPFLFFLAVQRYLAASRDRRGVEKNLLPAMDGIMQAFISGRAPGARLGADGLLYGGSEITQLTWMDAQYKGLPVTPRHGAAVEINALFFNAVVFLLEEFGSALTRTDAVELARVRRLFEKNFEGCFWYEEGSYLCDVYRSPGERDTNLRPNQLFALGLPASLISGDRALKVLETVKMHLVTPYGLRTLSPADPVFLSQYEGDQERRDAAYHQGMIWPWLVGIFFDAMKKQAGDREKLKSYFRSLLSPLWERHLGEDCVGQIQEIFTPLAPHRARGCPAQAWSLAEVIRVLEETK